MMQIEARPATKSEIKKQNRFDLPVLSKYDRSTLENLPWLSIVPSQQPTTRHDINPQLLNLYTAVLNSAFIDANRIRLYHCDDTRRKPDSLSLGVIDWLNEHDPLCKRQFSLESICEALQCDAGRVRSVLRDILSQQGSGLHRRQKPRIWHLGTYDYGFWNVEKHRYVKRGDPGFTEGAYARWLKHKAKAKRGNFWLVS